MEGFMCALQITLALRLFELCHSVKEGARSIFQRHTQRPSSRYRIETYPVSLETILRAEIAIFCAQLQASRTLERTSIVVAVSARTFPLRGFFGGHRMYDLRNTRVLPPQYQRRKKLDLFSVAWPGDISIRRSRC
jgi:hypothetical protein